MRNTKKTVRRTAVVGGTVAALLGAGVAVAAWTTDGVGDGTAKADPGQNLTVTVGQVQDLYPTGHFNVPFTIANPNKYNVKLSSLQLSDVTTTAAGCNATASVVSDTGTSDGSLVDMDIVPANNGSVTGQFPIKMTNDAVDECKGATFAFSLTAHGLSN